MAKVLFSLFQSRMRATSLVSRRWETRVPSRIDRFRFFEPSFFLIQAAPKLNIQFNILLVDTLFVVSRPFCRFAKLASEFHVSFEEYLRGNIASGKTGKLESFLFREIVSRNH